MKLLKAFKRITSLLLCVAMVMTTVDLTAITVKADDDMQVISSNEATISGDEADVNEIEVDGENRQYKIRGDGSLVTGWVRDNGWKYISSPVSAVGCQTGYPSYTDALGAATLSSDMASSTTLDMANIAPVSYMGSVNIAMIIPMHLKAHSLKSMMF